MAENQLGYNDQTSERKYQMSYFCGILRKII